MWRMKLAASLALTTSLSGTALAATQGTPGPSSTGTATITATITPEVNIQNLDDITFDAFVLTTALAAGRDQLQSDAVCVFSNNPDGAYFITATGDGAGSSFRLNDGTTTIDYEVQFDDLSGSGAQQLDAGVKSSRFVSRNATPDCLGAINARVGVTIPNAEIAQMEATTTYTGVLTLLVSPT